MRVNGASYPWARRASLVVAVLTIGTFVFAWTRVEAVKVHYRGFTFNVRAVRERAELSQIQAAVKNQILIVNSLNLAPDLLAFFQRVPIFVVPDERVPTKPAGNEILGLYQQGSILLPLRLVTRMEQPVLVHELLHAYHYQRLPGGIANADVRAHFRRASSEGRYAESPMMQNEAEFFAHSATAFLVGVKPNAPYSRSNLQQHLPEWNVFLASLFPASQ